MSLSTNSPEKQEDLSAVRASLVNKYEQLSDLEREIIQAVSVIYTSTSRTTLLSCLATIGTLSPKQKKLTSSTIRPYIENLLNLEVLLMENTKLRVHPLIIEIATRDAVAKGKFKAMVEAVESIIPFKPGWNGKGLSFDDYQEFIRAFRMGFYQKDFEAIAEYCQDYYAYGYRSDKIALDEVLDLVCNNPFDRYWFWTIPMELADLFLVNGLLTDSLMLFSADDKLEVLIEICEDVGGNYLSIVLAEQLILRGRIEEAKACLVDIPADYEHDALAIQGWLACLEGNFDAAIAAYVEALKALRKLTSKRKVYFESISGIFYVLTLLHEGSMASLSSAMSYIDLILESEDHWLSEIYSLLKKVLLIQQGDLSYQNSVINTSVLPYQYGQSLQTLISALCVHWVDPSSAKTALVEVLDPYCCQAYNSGYGWLASEAKALIQQLASEQPASKPKLPDLPTPQFPLAKLVTAQEDWQLSLKALEQLNSEFLLNDGTGAISRLAWFVSIGSENVTLEPKEQKRNAKGGWSKGRKIALSRLFNQPKSLGYLTTQDLKTCAEIEDQVSYYFGYHKTEYQFKEQAIAQLVGHPAVFWAGLPSTRIDIIKGEPELLVKEKDQGKLTLELHPPIPRAKDILVTQETPTRLKVIEINESHRRIAKILGKYNCLNVPKTAKEQVLSAISSISGLVTVQSDIGGGTENAELVAPHPIPHVHLFPAGDGLKAMIRVRPFRNCGSYFPPGSGGSTVITEIDGRRLQTNRDLAEEEQLAQKTIHSCPTLSQYGDDNGEWQITEPEDCLELLYALQSLSDQVIVEWPEGEKFRISHRVDLDHFKLKISQQQDWFAIQGEVNVDNTLVLDLQKLLALLDETSGRFIKLEEGQFLALTQSFYKRLAELQALSEAHGKGLRFHPLASVALEDLVEDVGNLQADQHWRNQKQRLQQLKNFEPEIPSTLQVQLRDYQIAGFRWLAKLSHWGVGACLADDMGLGKTLQALAVILTRAPQGPTLIVAPTSVGMNWHKEAKTYAPTLTPLQFDNSNRQQLLEHLKPFDMLICSYGLLQQAEVAEMLAQVSWQTIVLDEAQAIKNFSTKRSQAAMKLQGELKIITTGTPIENHLGELWNLFQFINPGLLGSLDSFNQRFAIPIERHQDKAARSCLKKLIQPFILRRTKSQVLEELPSRTEIVLQVDLSAEELAFYETLRRDALTKLNESDAADGPKHIQVLAELMRLRRVCCNPQLVLPETDLPSAKLQLFGEILNELLDNKHKALVFSQFVDHLKLIRRYLDEQQIQYQYLDGSTPAKDRHKRVDAFQAGEGEIFLISLKAGGTGLNLTAADYVIHMDPWWNPAVEDQASDRAHRIGQQRPVTIYRLVAKGTIEEKIVELHNQKRDLADSLLEGADMSGKVSTDELLRLMQQN
ncbi:DEAD/DEAH box helicase [Acaryochloris marina]|uniref:DEAD/DEAH box helicase n=1 Tax=Acaryochloris marina TaxID=155978 RepID=UPI0021C434C3|nr:DEAD/DEAH box helicase [Acaryochloris marina]BDM83242.1 SWF/SNF family helicase [Acaryochloris marina MBIC10699]